MSPSLISDCMSPPKILSSFQTSRRENDHLCQGSRGVSFTHIQTAASTPINCVGIKKCKVNEKMYFYDK